jgi:CheY-like chemotaxis protein
LTREALKENSTPGNLTVAIDGEEALDLLHGKGQYRRRCRPDIIILDLNLPRRDGREVLRIIKADEDIKRIPVVILTNSKAEEDIQRTYGSHANCYVTKPLDVTQFIDAIMIIEDFWFKVVKLPSRPILEI